MQDEIFEMHQFAVDPQRCASVGKVLAFEKTGADGRAGDALVETGQGDTCRFYFAISNRKTSYVC